MTAPAAPHPPHPWDRQSGETTQAWEAFQVYRDLPEQSNPAGGSQPGRPRRSCVAVGQQCGKNVSLIERWSARWSWVDRAAAWDEHLDQEWQSDLQAERRAVARRHVRQATAIQAKALARLAQLQPADLAPRDVLAFMSAGLEIEARIYGLDRDNDDDRRGGFNVIIDPRILGMPPGGRRLTAAELDAAVG